MAQRPPEEPAPSPVRSFAQLAELLSERSSLLEQRLAGGLTSCLPEGEQHPDTPVASLARSLAALVLGLVEGRTAPAGFARASLDLARATQAGEAVRERFLGVVLDAFSFVVDLAQEASACRHQGLREAVRLLFETTSVELIRASSDGNAEFQDMIEAQSNGIAIIGEDGRVLYANPAASVLLETPAEKLIGHELPAGLDRRCAPYQLSNGRQRVIEACSRPTTWRRRPAKILTLRDVTRSTKAKRDTELLIRALDHIPDGAFVAAPSGRILYVNSAFESITGYSSEDIIGARASRLKVDPVTLREQQSVLLRGDTWQGRTILQNQTTGEDIPVAGSLSPVLDEEGRPSGFVGVLRDARKEAEAAGRALQREKLLAIGRLASGVAHEINTPTQYIGDNVRFLQDSMGLLVQILDRYRDLAKAAREQRGIPEALQQVEETEAAHDSDYILEEIPKALEQTLEGVARVAGIVGSLKEFAHPGEEQKALVDLNRSLTSASTVCRNEWKYVAELKMELDPNLPPVPCVAGMINQAFLNLIVNAAHAIKSKLGGITGQKGRIVLSSARVGAWAEVRVRDSGTGIPKKHLDHIFEPFFTTKEVGEGTGQGLAMVHDVVAEKHGGTIQVNSEPGVGTEFVLRLPLDQPAAAPPAV